MIGSMVDTDIIDGGTGFDTLLLYRSDLTESVTVSMVSDGNGSAYEFELPDGTTVKNIERLEQLVTGSGDDLATFAAFLWGRQWWENSQGWAAGSGNDTAVVDFSAFSSNIDANYWYSGYRIVTGQLNEYNYEYAIHLDSVENLTLYGGSGNDNFVRSSGNNRQATTATTISKAAMAMIP